MTESDASQNKDLLPSSTKIETSLDLAAVVTSIVPWLGGPVSAVLAGMSLARKLDRVKEVLQGLAGDLKDLKSKQSEEYVKSDEFQELLEKALLKASEERSEQKRHIYRAFLTDAIALPGKSYDEQVRFLRTLEEIQPDHLKMLKAIAAPPEPGEGYSGSKANTLRSRLPNMSPSTISELVQQLNDMRISNLTGLNTMMTFRGSLDLTPSITPYGDRFLKFLQS